jgi:hypothetical protein
MKRVLLAIAALLAAAPAGAAVWGAKSRHCDRLTAHLAAREQDPDASPQRLRRLRERVANRCVALNEIQVLGSHNSYHVQPRPALLAYLLGLTPAFEAWEYTHPPLDEQFETQGVRQIELDVYADPMGGLYSRRGGLVAIGEDPESHLAALDAPGLKVMHIHDLDFESNCLTFVDCLRTVKRWSDAHPHHLPIMILIETEDVVLPELGYGFAVPIPFGPAQLDAIDDEIRSVFPRRRLLTPDRVRRGQPTLEQAVQTLGWPRLGAVRGTVMFMLDNGGAVRSDYLAGHPSLQGRVLFTDSTPGQPEAAFVKQNDPFASAIPTLVAQGYVVRTRADADTVEARSGDTGPRDAAIASGAQWVSTDYPVADPNFGTGYAVQIPGGMPARCNPLNAPPACRNDGLERLP